MLSRQVLSAWAKYKASTGESLSLVRHCEDAAEVAGYLWGEWLPDSTRTILAGPLTDSDARALARFLAGTHDIGKLSPAFADQTDLHHRMKHAGLTFPKAINRQERPPHSVISFHAIEQYLKDHGYQKSIARSYAVIAGGHHGVPPTTSGIGPKKMRTMYIGDEMWTEARNELIGHIVDYVGARHLIAELSSVPLTPCQQTLWTALVIMADWIASSDLFPLSDRSDSAGPAENAWNTLDLPGPWLAAPPDDLADVMARRFDLPEGAQPNSMQHVVIDAVRSMDEPGMLIVEATMGTGKTEAALSAAEYLAARFGLGGVFVALPTMATSNAMFSRVHGWLHNQDPETVSSVSLAHGKANLNDEYSKLDRESARELVSIGSDTAHAEKAHCRAEVIAHQWFFGRKRSMLANVVVGTIDQLLFAGLKAKHVVLRHLALANKVVILDEVHAADDYMRHYLVRVLEWLAAYGVPVILLSATLPGDQRVELIEAYERGRGRAGDGDSVVGDIGYPVVTCVQDRRSVHAVPVDTSTTVAIDRIDDDIDTLIATVREALSDGGCVAVIRNTVRRAQETARELRREFGRDVVLLHSRFVAQHRSTLEKDLVDELGRDGQRPERRIVVATQVIEQSLDLDFDLLVTDLAPIDLLFQRVGRLHRHRRHRPGTLAEPRVILAGVDDWGAEPPAPGTGSVSVYGRSRLLRAAAVLHGCNSLTVPADIPLLVQSAYNSEFDSPAGWESAIAQADAEHAARVADQRKRADSWRAWGPRHKDCLIDWLAEPSDDVDDPRGYAKVRDSDEGVEVLITQSVGGEVYLLPQCGRDRVETNFAPGGGLARKVLNSSIRLPAELSRGVKKTDETIQYLEKKMYLGWQESRWLAGELVIELDEEGGAVIGEYRLYYHADDGLLCEKVSD